MSVSPADQLVDLAQKLLDAMHNAVAAAKPHGAPHTFSDEYPWSKPPRPGFKPVDPDQKRFWEQAHNKR